VKRSSFDSSTQERANMTDTTTTTPTITHDDAMRVLRAEYFDTVRGIVEDLQRAIKDKEISSEDEAQDWLHETIDGHHDVIYTYAAQQVVLHSDHSGAYVEEYGTDGIVANGDINWSVLAYAALLADVRDAIGSELQDWIDETQGASTNDDDTEGGV
jgi:hypothetical protein